MIVVDVDSSPTVGSCKATAVTLGSGRRGDLARFGEVDLFSAFVSVAFKDWSPPLSGDFLGLL